MTRPGEAACPPGGAARADAPAVPPARWHAERFGAFHRICLPIALWVVFANGASHYRERRLMPNAGLREVVEAELASRHCPGLRLDETNFRRFAQEHGISHADLYQKRSVWLRKDAAALERGLHDDRDGSCRRMLDLYGRDGDVPHLLTRT